MLKLLGSAACLGVTEFAVGASIAAAGFETGALAGGGVVIFGVAWMTGGTLAFSAS